MQAMRKDINGQIRDKLAELGIPGEFRYVAEQGGRMVWSINGETMTTGQAADAYLPGGFAGNFGTLGGLCPPAKPATSTELAALIAASPRFTPDADGSRYFDEIAAKYGRDVAGLAFTQACLKVDQDRADGLPDGLKATRQGEGLLGW